MVVDEIARSITSELLHGAESPDSAGGISKLHTLITMCAMIRNCIFAFAALAAQVWSRFGPLWALDARWPPDERSGSLRLDFLRG